MRSPRSGRIETPPVQRLEGSGTVPRVFAALILAATTIFTIWWVTIDPAARATPLPYIVELLAVALLARSFFVGTYLQGDAVVARTWFRSFRYGPGELGAVAAVPYWKFLDKNDPILSLLKFRPTSGWVREVPGTVAWKDRTAAHAAAIRRHLGIEEDA